MHSRNQRRVEFALWLQPSEIERSIKKCRNHGDLFSTTDRKLVKCLRHWKLHYLTDLSSVSSEFFLFAFLSSISIPS